MKAKSIKGKSADEVKSALQQSMADGYMPTLAFVFISIKQDVDAVSNLLDQQGIQIFGAPHVVSLSMATSAQEPLPSCYWIWTQPTL